MKYHTHNGIKNLLATNDNAVCRGLQVVMSATGYPHGGYYFAKSLLKQIGEGKVLTKPQLDAARNLLANYIPTLVRAANANERATAKLIERDRENAQAEYDAEHYDGWERYQETMNELAYIRHGYDRLD